MSDVYETAGLRARNQSLLQQLKQQQHRLNTSIQISAPFTHRPLIPPKSVSPPDRPIKITNVQNDQSYARSATPRKMFVTPVKHDISREHVSFGETSYRDIVPRRGRRPSATSTPASVWRTAHNPHAICRETPKSILKKRKLIEDNVRVDSKFDHDWDCSKKQRYDLNYSYSKFDDTANMSRYKARLEHPDNAKNDSVFTVNQKHTPKRQRQAYEDIGSFQRNPSMLAPQKENKPLLGYDWIAGVLDMDDLTDQSESFFQEIRDFRKVNREECESRKLPFQSPLDDRAESPNIAAPDHQLPLNSDDHGSSRCPICNRSKGTNPTVESPSYVRISIPRSSLLTPYKVKPHRKKSFDPSDSCALSEHCLAGWESSRPAQLPQASNIDLRDASGGLRGKLTTTLATEMMSFKGTIPGPQRQLHRPSQLLSRSTIFDNTLNTSSDLRHYDNTFSRRGRSGRRTDELLETSRNLDFDQQRKHVGLR